MKIDEASKTGFKSVEIVEEWSKDLIEHGLSNVKQGVISRFKGKLRISLVDGGN